MLVTTSALPAGAVLYFAAALVLGLIPLNQAYRPAEMGIDLFIRTNGVHADLIVPVSAAGIDWTTTLRLGAIRSAKAPDEYLAIGWGDRGFYLETPRWSDLRFTTALSALTGLDATVLHVEVLDAEPVVGARGRHFRVTPENYRRLADFVAASFAVDGRGSTIIVPQAHYGDRDAFFEARGRYSLFVTCNEWTRRALAEAGVRVPVWAPFDRALLFQLPENR